MSKRKQSDEPAGVVGASFKGSHTSSSMSSCEESLERWRFMWEESDPLEEAILSNTEAIRTTFDISKNDLTMSQSQTIRRGNVRFSFCDNVTEATIDLDISYVPDPLANKETPWLCTICQEQKKEVCVPLNPASFCLGEKIWTCHQSCAHPEVICSKCMNACQNTCPFCRKRFCIYAIFDRKNGNEMRLSQKNRFAVEYFRNFTPYSYVTRDLRLDLPYGHFRNLNRSEKEEVRAEIAYASLLTMEDDSPIAVSPMMAQSRIRWSSQIQTLETFVAQNPVNTTELKVQRSLRNICLKLDEQIQSAKEFIVAFDESKMFRKWRQWFPRTFARINSLQHHIDRVLFLPVARAETIDLVEDILTDHRDRIMQAAARST